MGLGLLLHTLGNGLVWVSIHVVRSHLAFPIVLARRAIAGKPMWVPDDLQLGINPESPRARAAAAEAGFIEAQSCACGNPECKNAQVMVWVHKDQLEAQREMQRVANRLMNQGLGGMNVSISQRPPDPPAPPAS